MGLEQSPTMAVAKFCNDLNNVGEFDILNRLCHFKPGFTMNPSLITYSFIVLFIFYCNVACTYSYAINYTCYEITYLR